MIAQSVPDTSQIFCAQPTADGLQQGALSGILPGSGTVSHATDVESASQVYWVPRDPRFPKGPGDFQGTVSVVLKVGGYVVQKFLFHVENYINYQLADQSFHLCLSSPDGAQAEGPFDNFDFGPNMFWYIVKGPDGNYIDGTTFFFNKIATDGTTDKFAYFKNNIAANFLPAQGAPAIPNQFLEVYYTKMPSSQCHVNSVFP